MGNDPEERAPGAGCLRCDMNWQWGGGVGVDGQTDGVDSALPAQQVSIRLIKGGLTNKPARRY